MVKMIQVILGLAAVSTFFAADLTAAAEQKKTFENPPLKLDAVLIMPDGKMEGKGYKLEKVALNDGYSNTYTLKTEVGVVKAVSDYQLARQIQEIRALLILDEMSRAGVFGDAMKNGLVAPLKAGKALVTDPVETTKGTLLGIFPIDYLAWTQEASKIAASAEKNSKANNREILLEGSASPVSNKALTARGWKVKERVGLLTGNPLQNQTAAGAGAAATGTVIKTITP